MRYKKASFFLKKPSFSAKLGFYTLHRHMFCSGDNLRLHVRIQMYEVIRIASYSDKQVLVILRMLLRVT